MKWTRRATKNPEWEKGNKILAINHERLSKEYKTKVWKVSTSNKKYYDYKLLKYFNTKTKAMEYVRRYMKKQR